MRSARDGKPIAEGALRNLAAARVGWRMVRKATHQSGRQSVPAVMADRLPACRGGTRRARRASAMTDRLPVFLPALKAAVPTLALSWATSTELITPFAFTSSRKFEPLTDTPTCDLVRATSEALTAALPFTSPTSTPMETGTSPVLFTLWSVTVIVWTLVTPVRLTVTCDPLTLKLLTLPVPEVTDALSTVTVVAKSIII